MNQVSKYRDAIYRVHWAYMELGPGRDKSRPYKSSSFVKVHDRVRLGAPCLGPGQGGTLFDIYTLRCYGVTKFMSQLEYQGL